MLSNHRVPRAALLLATVLAVATPLLAKDDAFRISEEAKPLVAAFNVTSLNRQGRAALTGSPSDLGTFLPAFDRHLESGYKVKEAGAATLEVAFPKPQTLHGVAYFAGEAAGQWTLAAADNAADLEGRRGSYQELIPRRRTVAVGGDTVKLAKPVTASHFRLSVTPDSPQAHVEIREFNLLGEQTLEAIGLRSTARTIRQNDPANLEIDGYFSGGETRAVAANGAEWTVLPAGAANVAKNGRFLPRRLGPISIAVRVGKMTSPPLQLVVVDAD